MMQKQKSLCDWPLRDRICEVTYRDGQSVGGKDENFYFSSDGNGSQLHLLKTEGGIRLCIPFGKITLILENKQV